MLIQQIIDANNNKVFFLLVIFIRVFSS